MKDMSDRKIYSGGLTNIIDLALKNQNLALALKLSDILMAEGGKVKAKIIDQKGVFHLEEHGQNLVIIV